VTHSKTDQEKVVFYSKCRPYNIRKGIDFAKRNKIAFIGYPAWKTDVKNISIDNPRASMFDISKVNPTKKVMFPSHVNMTTYKREVSKNFNLIKKIKEGSFILVPDLMNSEVHIGKIKNYCGDSNEHEDKILLEDWKNIVDAKIIDSIKTKYPKSKTELTNENIRKYISGEIIQRWEVEKYVSVKFFQIPRWISTQLLRIPTAGVMKYDNNSTTLYDAVSVIYDSTGKEGILKDSNQELSEVLTPALFEFLMLELLQLVYPKYTWWHVGGSGDQGNDLIGFSEGKLVYRVQCKHTINDEKAFKKIVATFENNSDSNIAQLLCYYYLAKEFNIDDSKDNIQFWDKDKICDYLRIYKKDISLLKQIKINGD